MAEGKQVPLAVETVCLHSDTPGAGAIAKAVTDALNEKGVAVKPLSQIVH